jgi:hypothetical protein
MSKPYKLTLRLDPRADADLLAWLEGLRRQGHGMVSREVKAALRAHLTGAPSAAAAPSQDWAQVLADIRRVVEAALSSALDGVRLTAAVPDAMPDEDEAASLLDALGETLLLPDDEP